MAITNIRQHFHQLIDKINDEALLSQFYEALNENASRNYIWDQLTEQQQKEVLLSYEESEHPENIVTEPTIAEKYKEWLSK